jgi:urate oxidase
MISQIRYGKRNVTLYRTYAAPLAGLTSIPESPFVGRPNILFAADVDVAVLGDNFLPAYTEGDNRNVVATDTMKNFILQQSLAYAGATLEGLLDHLGRAFLATYPVMQGLVIDARELPFAAAPVPQDGGGFAPSQVLLSRNHDDHAYAELRFVRDDGAIALADQRSGRLGMKLIKITGSSFVNFARDEFTTLEERPDRPLFIDLDIYWRYAEPALALGGQPDRYVAAEQMRDLAASVFHEFVSLSIQHLVHEIGQRAFARFPQLSEVSFIGHNRTWDLVAASESAPQRKVYWDARAPFGQIELTMRQEG